MLFRSPKNTTAVSFSYGKLGELPGASAFRVLYNAKLPRRASGVRTVRLRFSGFQEPVFLPIPPFSIPHPSRTDGIDRHDRKHYRDEQFANFAVDFALEEIPPPDIYRLLGLLGLRRGWAVGRIRHPGGTWSRPPVCIRDVPGQEPRGLVHRSFRFQEAGTGGAS